MKLVLDFFQKPKLKVNGADLPSDALIKELIDPVEYQEVLNLLKLETEIITKRQQLLNTIRIKFNSIIESTPRTELKTRLESKYPEYFL